MGKVIEYVELSVAKQAIEDSLDLYPSEYDKVFSKLDELADDKLVLLDHCIAARDALLMHLDGLLEGVGASSDDSTRGLVESVRTVVCTVFSKLEEG